MLPLLLLQGDSVSVTGMNDPMKKVWVQQHKNKWNENSMLQKQLKYLSPNALDLLDKMFNLDEKERLVHRVADLGEED